MIRHYQQATIHRDVFALALIDVVTGAQNIQHALDEIQTLGSSNPIQHAVETVLIGQPAEHARHRATNSRMLRQPGQAFSEALFDMEHDCVLEFFPILPA